MIDRGNGNLFAICRQRGWDWRDVLDFSSNVNPLGCPEGVRAAVQAALDRISLYPECDPPELAQMIAERWSVGAASVVLGNGGTDLLHFFARAGWHGPVALATPASGGHLSAFPKAMKVPVGDPQRWPQRGLLVLTNPNQPTGELLPETTLRRAVAMREGPVLIDESYIEFSSASSAAPWCESHPNLIVLRSLTPLYGLAGLRVGALVAGADWSPRLRQRREPWQVGVLAQAAALAALQDTGFAERSRLLIQEEREWLRDQIASWPGVEVSDAAANYLLLRIPKPAAGLESFLLDRRILIRNYTGLPGIEGQAVGVAVRTRPDNQRLVAAAEEYLCGD